MGPKSTLQMHPEALKEARVGPRGAGGDSRGAKMDPQVAQEGSWEMHKGRSKFNTVLGIVFSLQPASDFRHEMQMLLDLITSRF